MRRLDQAGDWVRKEIEAAFGAGSLVVPLLVEEAKQHVGMDGEGEFGRRPDHRQLLSEPGGTRRRAPLGGEQVREGWLAKAGSGLRTRSPSCGGSIRRGIGSARKSRQRSVQARWLCRCWWKKPSSMWGWTGKGSSAAAPITASCFLNPAALVGVRRSVVNR